MRFNEIGQQLRAYRMESGLKAEEISARLGVSRAALYRYEKGEVIKLDTVNRLAELLKISPLTLLGIGVEYYSKPVGYAERLRQIEETSDQILQVHGPLCYLITSEHYDALMAQMLEEHADAMGADRMAARASAEQLMNVMIARKQMYASRKPSIIAILTAAAIQKFLADGICPQAKVSDRLRVAAREMALREIETMANLMESEPIGLQLGLMAEGEPNGAFTLLRARDRATLAINPFPADALPSAQSGVAMITNAEDAVAAHQRVAELAWREAVKGAAAAERLRALVAAARG
ncbi:helix-turn-helix domain-containing protein [Acidocella sp. KAb 2-4]|uniref:helix-turn-helix domain-containing protein n=1 Tax=Acidocella sp. KAb 2-4 TaxID=2885158 RepID=UPI001D0941EF|nr:helix-turn-helix transcriptional regulator [Acidocella sp. KAb 2-4]MCB5944940.1 helix-turn-helix transcriptional regulator [Acidocella sp. KAb 2-4]